MLVCLSLLFNVILSNAGPCSFFLNFLITFRFFFFYFIFSLFLCYFLFFLFFFSKKKASVGCWTVHVFLLGCVMFSFGDLPGYLCTGITRCGDVLACCVLGTRVISSEFRARAVSDTATHFKHSSMLTQKGKRLQLKKD